ncbi:hypothetical protein [Methylocystis parvus]|uniref:hypothetical protein n=1 Tax=Methylocystis parvus TaxID=134 RepID=UPI003C71650C
MKTAQEWTYDLFMLARIKDDISNRVTNEWAAVKKAPLAALTLTLTGAGAGFFLASTRYDLALQSPNAAVASKSEQIVMAPPQQLEPIKPRVSQAKPNYENLYQFRKKVGVVDAAKIDEEHGMIYFPSVLDATTLNPVADFEYKDYVLHLSSANIVSLESVSENKERILGSVKCLIVGRMKD